MDKIIGNKEIPLAHFYIVESNTSDGGEKIISSLEKRGVLVNNNPDLLVLNYETLKIEDLEFIKSIVLKKTLENETYFIISFVSIAREAQHALLKTLEDPRALVHFFLIVKDANSLIDTVRSRAQILKFKRKEEDSGEIEKFLKQSKSERLKYIESLVKEHEDDESSAPLRSHAIDILNGIESIIHKNKEVEKNVSLLEETLQLKSDLNNRGASVKMILEYVALRL